MIPDSNACEKIRIENCGGKRNMIILVHFILRLETIGHAKKIDTFVNNVRFY